MFVCVCLNVKTKSTTRDNTVWLGYAQATPVAHKENREVDMRALQRQLVSLPTSSLKQPFSSADFYIFGKTLGEGAYGKVKLGTHLLSDEKVGTTMFYVHAYSHTYTHQCTKSQLGG
jgi:hypothetical protein